MRRERKDLRRHRGIWTWTKTQILYELFSAPFLTFEGWSVVGIRGLQPARKQRNLNRSTVRTSDFKSENLGSIPSWGAFLICAPPQLKALVRKAKGAEWSCILGEKGVRGLRVADGKIKNYGVTGS